LPITAENTLIKKWIITINFDVRVLNSF